jgi:hypothetical protein
MYFPILVILPIDNREILKILFTTVVFIQRVRETFKQKFPVHRALPDETTW